MKKMCEICSKEAKYEQFSPDGLPYYYCSKKHEEKHFFSLVSQGIFWRALPAMEMKTNPNPTTEQEKTEINTRLWYALGDVEPTEEKMKRAVESIHDLLVKSRL